MAARCVASTHAFVLSYRCHCLQYSDTKQLLKVPCNDGDYLHCGYMDTPLLLGMADAASTPSGTDV